MLDDLIVFHNCFACAFVIVVCLSSMASCFPTEFAYTTRSLRRTSGCLPTSVRQLSRIEVHSHSETLPEQLVIRSRVELWMMMMVPSFVQLISPSRLSARFATESW